MKRRFFVIRVNKDETWSPPPGKFTIVTGVLVHVTGTATQAFVAENGSGRFLGWLGGAHAGYSSSNYTLGGMHNFYTSGAVTYPVWEGGLLPLPIDWTMYVKVEGDTGCAVQFTVMEEID